MGSECVYALFHHCIFSHSDLDNYPELSQSKSWNILLIIIESHTRRVNNLCRIWGRLRAITPKQKKECLLRSYRNNHQTHKNPYNQFLIDKAHTIQIIFNDLNSAFRTIHKFISHTAPIDDSSLPDIQTAIDNYMATYRRISSQI